MANNSIKILVIDDLQDNLITLDALIKDAFPEAIVLKVQSGKKGLELAAKENPDVILLDILMPGMDGYEVCQKLKADKELCDIPVVFVTAIENNKEALVKALDSGGEAFLTKPIDEIELTAQIRAMLKIREANNAKKDEKVRLEKLVEERNKELVLELEARKQAEEYLQKFKHIVSSTSDGISLLDKKYRYVIVNKAYETFSAKKQEDVIGLTLAEYLGESVFKKQIKARFDRCLNGEIIKYQDWFEYPTLGKRFVEVTYFPYIDTNGRISGVVANTRDITDRKRAEEALKESEEKFRGLYEQSPIAIEIYDKHGKLIDVNQQTLNMFGVDDKKHVLGFDLFADPNLSDEKMKLLKSGQEIFLSREFDFEIVKENKLYPTSRSGKIYMDMYAIPLLNEKEITGFLVQIVETTDRRKAVEKLKESEERFKTIVENGSVLLTLTDSMGRIEFASPQCERVIGWKEKDIMGVTMPDFVHPDDRLRIAAERKKVTTQQAIKELEYRIIDKENKIRWVSHSAAIIKKGDAFSILSTITNITDRKQAEESNKELLKRFELIGLHLPGVIYQFRLRTDGSFHFPYASSAISEIYGVMHEEVEHDASNAFKAIHPDDLERVSASINHSAQTLKPWHDVYRVNKTSGKIIWVEGNSTPIKLEDGSIIWHGFIQNITERKRIEESLLKSEERFKLAMNASNDGLFDWNLLTNEIYYSPTWKKIIGYEDHELPNDFSVWETTTSPEDVKKSWELQQKLISKQIDRFELEFKMKHRDGHWVDLLSRAKAIFDNKGKAIRIVGTHTDITERKRAEEAIMELKDFNESIVTNLAEGIILENDNGIIQFANPAMVNMLGYKEGELVGKHWTCFVPDDQIEVVKNANKRREKGESDQYEMELIRKDGERIFVLVGGVPNFNKGAYIGLLAAFTDITKRKQAEAELIKLSTAVQQSPSVIVITDTEGNLQYANPKFTRITGYSVDEAIGKNPRILKSGKQSDEFYKELWEIISSGKVWRGEFHNIKKNGELFWEQASVSPIFNEKGKIVNYIKVAEDITERKQAEDNFRHSIDESPLGIRIVNQTGKTIYVNSTFLDIYEFTSIFEYINTKSRERYTDKSYQEHQERKKIRKKGGDTSEYEISIRRKNGEIRHIKVWRKEVIWNREKHFQVINQDITELKRLNTDLILAKEKAEESNLLKTAFLNNMSHEIRTPLNGITGFIGLLQDSEIADEEKQHYFDIINKSSDRLIATVTDIMDISRIEAGEVKVSKSEVSVNEILEEQYSFFYHQAQSKGLELIYKPGLADKEARFITDKHKLEGILTNLIKNAIKFTEQGEITFACSLKKEQDIEVLEFYVKDTGIGIPANRIEAIFNRFEQADIEDTRVYEGSGLGLAIAKSYVEMLGGEITVSSEVGLGSTFTFSIPYTNQFVKESEDKDNINKETQTTLSNLLVIIAEDDEASKMYFEAIFRNEFKNITYTKTGKETIDKCRENPETNIILMDIKMPGMNGYDATREIRKFNSDVIIIAQTAFGLSGDREKAIEVGCNDYIAKPIKKEELFEKIIACVNKKSI